MPTTTLPSGHVAEVNDQIPRSLAKRIRRELMAVYRQDGERDGVAAIDALDDATERILLSAVTSLTSPGGNVIAVTAESLGELGDGDFELLEQLVKPIFDRLVPGLLSKAARELDPKSDSSSSESASQDSPNNP